jgi:5'-nucleotidase
MGLPAVAMSLVGEGGRHFETAARVAVDLVERLVSLPLPADTILNVNVPDLPYEDLKGMRATRLGNRHRAESAVRARDPRNHVVYWIGPAGPEQDCGPGTDFDAVGSGHVSVTPLQVDLTRYTALDDVGHWLDHRKDAE